jgi:uncharacterized Zn finger protein
MTPDWLPPGGRPHHEPPTLTLENCQAVRIGLEVPAPRIKAVIVWRDGPRRVKPEPLKPIRQLVAGDVVVIDGERRIVTSIEPFR